MFTSNDGSQNTFAHQPTLAIREYIILNFYIILNLSHYRLFSCIAFSGYRMGIKLDKDSLAVEENGYLRKIVNVYIVYELDAWPRNPTKNFNFKSFIFRATSVVKNKEKEKRVYMGYGIIFSSAGSWIFDNDTAKNVIIFRVDIFSCSSYHADNRKNKYLVLVKGFVLFLEKQVQNFA